MRTAALIVFTLLACSTHAGTTGAQTSDSLNFEMRDGYQIVVPGTIGPLEGTNLLSPDPPPRPPLDNTQVLTHGAITDVQAFGYDETDIAEHQREAERQQSRKRLWRLCRQELYLNPETLPFATINRRYTLDAVEILRVHGIMDKAGPVDDW